MHYQHSPASLVMMRSGVQFSLAAPSISQQILELWPLLDKSELCGNLHNFAEPDANKRNVTSNARPTCSRFDPRLANNGPTDTPLNSGEQIGKWSHFCDREDV